MLFSGDVVNMNFKPAGLESRENLNFVILIDDLLILAISIHRCKKLRAGISTTADGVKVNM
jgi:hypothetical protein